MIAVLGPGGVGGFIAGALQRAGKDMVVVAREPVAYSRGLRIESVRLGDFEVRLRAVGRLEEPVDALIVATKSWGLESALDRIAVDPDVVLPLLNGLDHVPLLRERFPHSTVPAATIRIESDRPQPGLIRQTSRFLRIDIENIDTDAVRRLAADLEAAAIPTRLLDSAADVLWGKLVRLNALALTTSAYDLPLGEIRSDPEKAEMLEAAVQEGAAVARAEGATVDADSVMAELADAHASLGSSMQRDIAAGRPTELDAIAGAVLRAAQRHSLECAAIADLRGRVEARVRPSR